MKASKTSLIGRLAADPMLLENNTGDESKDRVWFRVITNRRFGDKLDSHACLCWGKQGRAVLDHCTKGKEVYIEGEPHIEARPVHDAAGNPLNRADGRPLMTNYYEVGVTYVSFGADSKAKQDERARAQGVQTAPAPAVAPPAQVAAVAPANVASLSPEMQALVAQTAAGIVANMQANQAQANSPQTAPQQTAVAGDPAAHDPIPYTAG